MHQHDLLQCAGRRRAHDLRGQTLSHGQRCLAPHQRRPLGLRDGDCVRLAQSPRFLSSPAASFRFTELLWQHLKPIMSTISTTENHATSRYRFLLSRPVPIRCSKGRESPGRRAGAPIGGAPSRARAALARAITRALCHKTRPPGSRHSRESKNRTIAQEPCARGATARMHAERRRFDRTAIALRLHASCSSPDQPVLLMTIPVRRASRHR